MTEHHLEFLSLKESCTGLSESTLIKMTHCWESHIAAHINVDTFWICQGQFQEVATMWLLCTEMVLKCHFSHPCSSTM